jgi:hypothetical protein
MTAPALPVICKGTILEQYISNTYVAIAGVISIDLPDQATETFESDYLANPSAGIPYTPTGRTEGGKCSGELWLDPSGTSGNHVALYNVLATPTLQEYEILFKGSPFTSPWPSWTFVGAGLEIGGTVALKEGLKGKFSIKLSGIPTINTANA